jgi:hypothetical protein
LGSRLAVFREDRLRRLDHPADWLTLTDMWRDSAGYVSVLS